MRRALAAVAAAGTLFAVVVTLMALVNEERYYEENYW